MYTTPMQVLRGINPMLNRYLRRSSFNMSDEVSRNLFQIEGYMRYRNGHISFKEMTDRGTMLASVPLVAAAPSGTMIEIDEENGTTFHDRDPIGVTEYQNKYSYIGHQQRAATGSHGKVIRVDNREAINPHATYMWTVAPTHRIKDICDEYHGRVYSGADAPPPLHLGCNCLLRELDVSQIHNPTFALNSMGENQVWGNVHKFVEEVNKFNEDSQNLVDSIEDTISGLSSGLAGAAALMIDPRGYILDKAATSLVGLVKEQTIAYARKQIQNTVLSTLKQNTGELNGWLSGVNSDIRKAQTVYNSTTRLLDELNSVNSVSSAIGLLQNTNNELESLGMSNPRLQRLANSPILEKTKVKAVMLEGGTKGLTKLAMILF